MTSWLGSSPTPCVAGVLGVVLVSTSCAPPGTEGKFEGRFRACLPAARLLGLPNFWGHDAGRILACIELPLRELHDLCIG